MRVSHEPQADRDAGEQRDAGVVVDGRSPVTLPESRAAASAAFDLTTETVGFECASGDWLKSMWTGVRLGPLIEAAEMPASTTHTLLTAAGGYRACVPILAVTDAMVAYDAADRSESDCPRFVSPSVGGPRAVKDLARVEPVEIAPSEDPEEYEDLQPDEP